MKPWNVVLLSSILAAIPGAALPIVRQIYDGGQFALSRLP